MRIIAGQWRGRPIVAPKGDATRPTADRTREALFSMLTSRVGSFEGLAVADLFAGSGALGIEALSRGAAIVPVRRTGQAGGRRAEGQSRQARRSAADVRATSVMALGPAPAPLDLILMDPPYGTGAGAVALDKLARLGWIGPATWISIETAKAEDRRTRRLRGRRRRASTARRGSRLRPVSAYRHALPPRRESILPVGRAAEDQQPAQAQHPGRHQIPADQPQPTARASACATIGASAPPRIAAEVERHRHAGVAHPRREQARQPAAERPVDEPHHEQRAAPATANTAHSDPAPSIGPISSADADRSRQSPIASIRRAPNAGPPARSATITPPARNRIAPSSTAEERLAANSRASWCRSRARRRSRGRRARSTRPRPNVPASVARRCSREQRRDRHLRQRLGRLRLAGTPASRSASAAPTGRARPAPR